MANVALYVIHIGDPIMRVAIIETNSETQKLIMRSINGYNSNLRGNKPAWEIDFYIDPEKFFIEKNEGVGYDLVMVDCDKGDKVCFDFIHRISNTCDAELCLLTNNKNSDVLSDLMHDDSIKQILDKNDLYTIISHLEYSSAKFRIKKHLLNESAIYAEIKEEMF